jgi:predicted nucleotidyltransferase
MTDDLRELIELLQSHQVEFLVVGAHALAFHALPRFTEDIDFFVRRTRENANKIRQALVEFGFPVTEDAEDRMAESPRGMIVLGRKPNQIDFLNFLDGVEFDTAWARRVRGRLGPVEVDYIGLADYIATKRASGRPKDNWDLAELERILGDPPDA